MNVEKAIKILKLKVNCTIEKTGHNLFVIHFKDGLRPEWQKEEYTARELIKYAKIYTSENNQQTTLKKLVKEASKRKNRARERQDIENCPDYRKDVTVWDYD